MRSQYDVTIIGAGPAGSVAAIAFARRGATVLLAEANPKAALRFAGEWLHPPAVQVLERLGLLPLEAARGHESGRGFAVFPDDGEAPIKLPYPDGAVGLSCEHGLFVNELRARAAATPGIDYVPGARVTAIGEGSVRIQHDSLGERLVATGQVVGAEGRGRSISREHLGLSDASSPISWMAGVELHDVEVPFAGYGHVILGGPGPILLYPIGPGRARACLDIPLDRCPNRRDTDLLWRMFRPVLPRSLTGAFREALAARRVVWAAIRSRPRSERGRGNVALIGDTVGYSHPLTAVGMTLGLDDAEVLAASRDVEHYRRQRERPSYVAELLSNSLYHVLSREDASVEPIRTAVYHMWGDSEAERRRTMRILITEDYRSVSFAATFLRVATGALKHLIHGSRGGDWWIHFPSVAGVLNGPGSLLQWPTAALIPQVIRGAYQARSTPRTPIPHLRLITGPEQATLPARTTPRPSESQGRAAMARAFGELEDLLQEGPPAAQAAPAEDWPRIIAALNIWTRFPGGSDLAEELHRHRRDMVSEIRRTVESRGEVRPARLAELLLAASADAASETVPAGALGAALELLQFQNDSGGFAPVRPTASLWRRPLRRWAAVRGDLQMTWLCCRALAEVASHPHATLAGQLPAAMERAMIWLLRLQRESGSWPGTDGQLSVSCTAAGLEALVATGARPASRGLRRAAQWLRLRQGRSGFWCEAGAEPDHILTARVVRALIAARSAEVDAIERGVNALLDASGWEADPDRSPRAICDLAEGLAAFVEWTQDLPGTGSAGARAGRQAGNWSLGLHG